jgi:phage shock protein E
MLPFDLSSATIVVYCGTGKRASIARERLMNVGYTNVLNGGSLEDVLAILKQM